MDDRQLRSGLIRLAHQHPELRDQILPVLKEATLTTEALVKLFRDATDAVATARQKIYSFTSAVDHLPEVYGTKIPGNIRVSLAGLERTLETGSELIQQFARGKTAVHTNSKGRTGPPLGTPPAGKKIPVNTTDIRSGYYKMTDGFGALEDALKSNDATKGDNLLQDAVKDVEKAIANLSKALKPYSWD